MAELWTGAPNDGFVLNTLKTLFRLSSVAFRCLEMNSKPRYKICVCSVIPGERESFRDYQVFSIIFPKILDAMWRIRKERFLFLIHLSFTFFNPKILHFLFSSNNNLTWGVKCEKNKYQKIVGNLDELRKFYINGTVMHLEIFSRPQSKENSRQYLRLRTDILQKTVVACPWVNFRLQLFVQIEAKNPPERAMKNN